MADVRVLIAEDHDVVREGIRLVLETDRVLTRVRQSPLFARDQKLGSLTPREDEILKLLATGRTNAQIARETHISEKTVKNHVSTILGKLEVARRTEAAAYFAQHRNPFG